MDTITYNVPVLRRVSVLVIGGGCAGFAAAVCAARHGAKTLLCEAGGCLGGMATSGLIGPFMTSFDAAGEKQVIKGFFDEFIRRMEREGGAIGPDRCPAGSSYAGYRVAGHAACTPFQSECYKRVAEDMCAEAGVELCYHVTFVSARVSADGRRMTGAVFAGRGGLFEVEADIVIDCTGDAHAAAAAGAPCRYGDEDGTTQPCSLFFIISGVDKTRLEASARRTGDHRALFYEQTLARETEAGRYTVPRTKVAMYENPDGTFRVNMSRVVVKDVFDPFQFTQGQLTGRKQIENILSLLRRAVPGCENIVLTESASILGVREGRRIAGDFVLTGEDIAANRRFADDIFLAANSMDMHGGNKVDYRPAKGKPYGVPYRILLPARVENMLVAGRSCSMDRFALAAIRVMPPVFSMGQAAGTAAALALRQGVAPADVDIPALQRALREDGVLLEDMA